MRLRRLVVFLLAYLLGAGFVLGLGRVLAPLLVLPPLFGSALVVLLAAGLAVGAAAVWRYEPDEPADSSR